MGGIFKIIYIDQIMHQNKMKGVILKRNLKHYLKTYKKLLLKKYMVALRCGVYIIDH
jgi:hypothetical protein